MIDPTTIGVCCPGGGAKGARQAGTLKALFEWFTAAKAKPRRVSMASVGTLNGLLFVQGFSDGGKSIECMEYMWKTIRWRDIHGRTPNLFPGSRGFFHTRPLRRLIERTVAPKVLATSSIHFDVHATQLGGHINPKARPGDPDFLDIVRASASYPIVFKPVFARGFWNADRGLSNNRPTDELIADRCSTILVAHTGTGSSARRSSRRRLAKPSWYAQIPMVVEELFEAQIALQVGHIRTVNALVVAGASTKPDHRRIEIVDLHGAPEPSIGVLEFDRKKTALAFELAYIQARDTLRVLPNESRDLRVPLQGDER